MGSLATNNCIARVTTAMSRSMGSPRPSISGTGDGDPSLRRGPWSSQEDEILLRLVESHGPSNWVVIAHSLGTRSAKQCRERYHQNLKPSLDHSPIRPDEAETIERLVSQIGHRWAEIARRLPGRSDNTIKNWWNGKQNRISRHEHLRSTCTSRYRSVPPSPHPDYAGSYGPPQTPPYDDRFQAPSPFSSPRTYSSERDSAELAPYQFTSGRGAGPLMGSSPAVQAVELPPITGSREARPRTPADFPHRASQLPGIHTVLPPSPDDGGDGGSRHRSGRSSRMALDSLISR